MSKFDRLKALFPIMTSGGFYAECGEGWYDLVHDLLAGLEPLSAQLLLENHSTMLKALDQVNSPGSAVWGSSDSVLDESGHFDFGQLLDIAHVVCLKEKFGGLRCYLSCETQAMSDLIREAEGRSFRICEDCGAPGRPRPGSWIRTLCDEHAACRPGQEQKSVVDLATEVLKQIGAIDPEE